MSMNQFRDTKMRPILTSNPAVFMLNDISVGIINADIIKDMCVNMCIKNPPAGDAPNKPKIELVLQSILQQKSFYPLYPGS